MKEQEELGRREKLYRDFFENAKEAIYVHDLRGRYRMANRACTELLGYSREELSRLTVFDIFAPEYLSRIGLNLKQTLDHHAPTTFEVEIQKKHCGRVPVEISSRLIYENGIPVGVQGTARDISERKRSERALRESEDEQALRVSEAQLQQSQKLEAIGQLAGGVAHDFNNLLTAIAGYSDLTLRGLAEEDPLRDNLIEIKKATERAASLTRQLLAFSRKQILEPKILDLNGVVKDMSNMLRLLIGEDFELVTDLAADLGNVKADPGQVEQIIMNLVVNARDAMPHGGKVTIETQDVVLDETYDSHHIAVQPGEYTMLAISDTGTGMDRETQSHVFEPFFTTKASGKGTGLGLSTVYGIVKQSGGYVWVYSELHNGTVFKVYLPRVSGGARDEKSKTSTTGALSGSETILLVEDEEIVRRMARMILEGSGYTVLEAGDVKDALQLCYENVSKIDLMLTEVIMPGMSGRILAERVAVLRPDLPVVYMSGYTDDAIVRHGILEEDIVFLQKPFTRDSLLTKVREAVNNTLMAI